MWSAQMDLFPGATLAPTLYGFGDDIRQWATAVLASARGERLIVVGCSVGGSCALEIAALAPERVAALVLIGTKAEHRPEPDLHHTALDTIHRAGLEAAWDTYWAPLFSRDVALRVVAEAKRVTLRQSPQNIARGVGVFHTRPSRQDVLSTFPRPITIVTGADDVAPGPGTSARQAQLARAGASTSSPAVGITFRSNVPKP